MNRNSIRWRLPASYAVIALLAAILLGSVMLLVLRGYYANQEREYLYGNATALRPVIEQILQSHLPETSLRDQIKGLSFLSQTQIRLLDSNQKVIADSGIPDAHQVVAVSGGAPMAGNVMFSMPVTKSADQGPLFIYRNDAGGALPQVQPFEQAVPPNKNGDIIVAVNASPYGYGFVTRSEDVSARRSSQSVSVLLMAVNGNQLGTLEFSHGPSYGADVIDSVSNAWLLASLVAVLIAALVGWLMSKRVTQPVLVLEEATQQMERGNLAVRVHLPDEKQQEFISLAKSFNGMAEQVEQTVSTLRAFVADAAHELHTPLTALHANLELARDEENASDRTRFLVRAQEQSQRLEALVQSLLDLSRIEAAESRSDFVSVDLTQLVLEVGEQFASRAEQADRQFQMNVAAEPISVAGNENQLKQVLINLLENALKFTPPQGCISLVLEHSSHEIHLTVTDTGMGIPAEDMPHLFERFHRGRNASEYPGNGLGLAIVKATLTAHHGTVAVQSQLGQGTTMAITLPESLA